MKYKPTILIADDSKTFAMYFSILLGRMGFDVIPVENGEEACKLASVFKPDIITLDTEMPVMDGVTALRHIKEDKILHSLPVVMLTTNATNDMVQNCMKLGCNGYLTKPVNIHKLHDMLQNCLVFPHGKKRKYLRSTANKKVFFSHSDTEQELEAISVSEGGVFVRTKDLLSIGTKVGITLAFDNNAELYLQGTIIYTKDIYPGGLIRRVPGMGIAFDTLNDEQSEQLRDFILQQLAADIIEEQEEPVITLD